MNKYRTEEIHKIVVLCLDLVVFSISRKCHLSGLPEMGQVHMLGTVSVILQSLHTQHTIHSFACAFDTNLMYCNSRGKNMF